MWISALFDLIAKGIQYAAAVHRGELDAEKAYRELISDGLTVLTGSDDIAAKIREYGGGE